MALVRGGEPALTKKTAASYRSLLRSRIVPVLGNYRLADLLPVDIQAWANDMKTEGLSASRIRQAHVILQLVLKSAVRNGLVARNAAEGVSLPRIVKKEAPFFEAEVVDAIVASVAEPYDLLLRVMGVLGPRWAEAVGLQRRSVDLLRRRLIIDSSLTEVGGPRLTSWHQVARHTARTHPTVARR